MAEAALIKVFTLEEFKARKLEAEKAILEVLRKFEKDTNTKIVDLNWSWSNSMGEPQELIDLKLRVDL